MRVLFNIFFIVGLITSCGKSKPDKAVPLFVGADTGATGVNQNETVMADGSNINGIYATDLYPMNHNLQLEKVGKAALKREGDRFTTLVKIDYGQKGTTFKQAIYTGRRCPNINDDLNKDAYIDIEEARSAMGVITIPLDGNIDSQQLGINDYPKGDPQTGKYFYEATTSFDRMFADLKIPDENPNDNIIKLEPQDGLTFPGRIILLQGLNESVFLPTTAASTPTESAHKTIPIACGVLWKVEALPNEFQVTR